MLSSAVGTRISHEASALLINSQNLLAKSNDPVWIKRMHYHGTGRCAAVQVFHGDLAVRFVAQFKGGYNCGKDGAQSCRYYHYQEDNGIATLDSFNYQVNCTTGAVLGPLR